MKTSSEEWRIGRMGRKGRCEQLGAKVRNRRLHGSRTLESLKLPMAQSQNMGLVRHLRSGVGGENSSDRGDQRGLLDASGNAGCDDYPDWGTSLRPIRSPSGGSFASQSDYIGRARVLIGELSSEFELWQPKELTLGIDKIDRRAFFVSRQEIRGICGFLGLATHRLLRSLFDWEIS